MLDIKIFALAYRLDLNGLVLSPFEHSASWMTIIALF